jgi:hypothetical protein
MEWPSSLAIKTALIALLPCLLTSCNENEDDLKDWLVSTPIDPPTACPTAPAEPSSGPPGTAVPQKPYFRPGEQARKAAEAGRPVSCLQDGPYLWHGTQWYVQRIKFVDDKGQKHAAVRVCSLQAEVGKYGPARDLVVSTPGGPLQNVSENLCQLVASY